MLPRSQGGLLMSISPSDETIYTMSLSITRSALIAAAVSEYTTTIPDNSNISINTGHGASSLPNRQSTSTSEALQYYWSSSAGGERSGSFSSNLGMSPIDSSNPHPIGSPYSLSPHPATMSPRALMQHSSSVSLHDLVAQEAEQERLRAAGAFSDAPDEEARYEELRDQALLPRVRDESSEAGPSNRRIHLVSYSSDGSVSRLGSLPSHPSINQDVPPSPTGSNSGESEYSLEDDNDGHRIPSAIERDELVPRELYSKPRQPSARSGERPRGLVDTDGKLDVLLDPSFEEWAHQRVWVDGRGSSSPAGTVTGRGAGSESPRDHSAPDHRHNPSSSSTLLDRRQKHMSPTSWSTRTPSPGLSQGERGDHTDWTPRSSSHTPRGSGSRLPGSKGRMLFVAPADVSRRSLDALEREVQDLSLGGSPTRGSRVGLSVIAKEGGDETEPPHSAPPHKTSFGDFEKSDEDKRRPTSLLPSVQMASPNPAAAASQQLSPPKEDPILERRSPEPPPRSERRKRFTPSPPDAIVESPATATSGEEGLSQSTVTPPLPPQPPHSMRTQTLPTIINTPHTPMASPQGPARLSPPRASTAPLSIANPDPSSRPSSPVRPGLQSSGTLQDLSDLLSGAIDDIGLIDSRETPPPTINEPAKSSQARVLSQLPTRVESAGVTGSPPQEVLISTPEPQHHSLSPATPAFGGQSSPGAGRTMLNSTSPVGLGIMGAMAGGVAVGGSSATQRTSNNVARHVRKASSILSLRSINHATSPTANTFTAATPSKLPKAIFYNSIKQLNTPGERARAYAQQLAGLGQTESGLAEWCYNMQHMPRQAYRPEKQQVMAQLGLRPPEEPTARNVSTGSEFPMRPDAYAAREISVRNLDPNDAPTALPPNLPYPQLQGVKGSGSMQSLVSISSTTKPRAGFRNMMGKLRRDKENTGLGPPTGAVGPLNGNAMGPRRDHREMRNVSISGPWLDNSPSGRQSLDSIERVNPSLAVPRGPRESPTVRASFDAPRPRGSVDGNRPTGNGAVHPSPLRGGYGFDTSDRFAVNDDDVRNMSDMLPQSERSVVRHYLAEYGDPTYAMTAYIEDEKRGQLLRT